MNTYSQKTSKNTDNSHLNKHSQKKNNEESAFQFVDNRPEAIAQRKLQNGINNQVVQAKPVIQLVLTAQDLEGWDDFETAEDLDDAIESGNFAPAEKRQIKKYWADAQLEKAKQKAEADKLKKWATIVEKKIPAISCISWDYDGERYHINLTTDTYHVTKEASPKTHYFFSGTGEEIKDEQPTQEERGSGAAPKLVFSKLNKEIQDFIKANWDELIL